MYSVKTLRFVIIAVSMFSATSVFAQIARDEYLKYVPLTYPHLVRETRASARFNLYGGKDDPAYRDVDPRDGVDDDRAGWLHELGIIFAPIMVKNSALHPVDFRAFFGQPSFAVHVDTWDLARSSPSFIEGTSIGLSDLADRPCTPPDTAAGQDCRLLELVREFGPRRGPVQPEVAAGAEQERFTVMYFDFPGYDDETWKEEYWPDNGRDGSEVLEGNKTVFMHPFIAEAGSDDQSRQGFELVLQYWFFYPVNDGPNNHEGDWEHINVIVTPRSTVERTLEAGEIEALIRGEFPLDDDDQLVIKRIDYYFHHYIYTMDFSSPNAYQPREVWESQVSQLRKQTPGGTWMWEKIRERAWQDAAETRINTRPVVWIGGDAIGVQSVLEMPGLRDRDGHASYPFRGYYKQIGPGVSERVMRGFDHRRFFDQQAEVPEYVEDYGRVDRVVLLPDWECLVEPVLNDPAARLEWAWFLLPIRFGFPASPSPVAGFISHRDLGNVSVVGPTFNGGWNRIGTASGYALYDAVKRSWAAPLGTADSFLPRAGFLNAPILYFMIKPPLDLAWRTMALPVRAVVGSRQPTFFPANAPARRQVSLEAGMLVTPISEDFLAAFLNRDQLLEILLQILINLGPEPTDLEATAVLPTATAPVYSIAFHLSPRFTTESSLASYSARIGFDMTAAGVTQPVEVRGNFKQFDYNGNLRFNLLTGSIQPYVKYGSGFTWYELEGVSVNGEVLLTPDSPRFRPEGSWYTFWFNEHIFGGGIDINRIKLGKTWLGLKASYSAIHHDLGFEKEAAVELSPDLARELAGTVFSVWRHELRIFGSVSF